LICAAWFLGGFLAGFFSGVCLFAMMSISAEDREP